MSTIRIGTLSLQLPAGYGPRATAIARLVGRELAELQPERSLKLDHLRTPPISVPKGAGDLQVARSIARSIASQLGGGKP